MTKRLKVIFNSMYTLGFSNPDNKSYNKNKSIKRAKKMYDYYSNEDKRVMSMYDYYTGKIGKENDVNLILENGEYASKEEIERRKERAVKYLENSNLWQGVLSFENDYINSNIDIHVLEKKLATEILPMFFKHCGFKDKNKMFYQLALHGDTDNLHFHFSFMEKSPNYINNNNELSFRRKGELTSEEINFLKNLVVHTIEKEKVYTPLLTEVNKALEELKKYFNPNEKNFLLKDKKDLLLEEKILRLGQLLYNERLNNSQKIKYGSIKNKEVKVLTNEIKRYLFSKSSQLNLDYEKFKYALNDINDYFLDIYKDNNIKDIKVDTSLTDRKNLYFNNYVSNAIVNHALYNYKKEITKDSKIIKENDIIQSIILKQYIKNKKQNRKDILDNYLSNKTPASRFKNKRKVEQAIRKINDEMEEAQKEFSKLFINENDRSREI